MPNDIAPPVSTDPGASPGRPSAELVTAIVVTYESSSTLEGCLTSLRAAAPRRGVRVLVVDNASRDSSADIAARLLGPDQVIRLVANRGFAAGVNAGLERADSPFVAVLNPDVEIPAGALDQLADELEARPRAGLIGPATADAEGRLERTVGPFPTPAREWAHAWLLDHLGWPGRFANSPRTTGAVDWVSGCAWLMRSEAMRAVGPLDEEYFMYFEDVDYCRRLREAGWEVLHAPAVRWMHRLGRGSSLTDAQPADGGLAALRYFRKFHPGFPEARARSLLVRGWKLRLIWRRMRVALGHRESERVARRYAIAIAQLSAR